MNVKELVTDNPPIECPQCHGGVLVAVNSEVGAICPICKHSPTCEQVVESLRSVETIITNKKESIMKDFG